LSRRLGTSFKAVTRLAHFALVGTMLIRRLIFRTRFAFGLWQRKRARRVYSDAAKRGHSTRIHNQFANDPIMQMRREGRL
jgi:hypothetical protein